MSGLTFKTIQKEKFFVLYSHVLHNDGSTTDHIYNTMLVA